MVAWDGTRWGTSLSGVPPDQLGRTDIVRHYLLSIFSPPLPPNFMQPAIVPFLNRPLGRSAQSVRSRCGSPRVRGGPRKSQSRMRDMCRSFATARSGPVITSALSERTALTRLNQRWIAPPPVVRLARTPAALCSHHEWRVYDAASADPKLLLFPSLTVNQSR